MLATPKIVVDEDDLTAAQRREIGTGQRRIRSVCGARDGVKTAARRLPLEWTFHARRPFP